MYQNQNKQTNKKYKISLGPLLEIQQIDMFQACNISEETISMKECETFIRNTESPMHCFPTEYRCNRKHG